MLHFDGSLLGKIALFFVLTAIALGAQEPADPLGDQDPQGDTWIVRVTVVGEGVEPKPTELIVCGVTGFHWPETMALRVTMMAPGVGTFDLSELIAIRDARFAPAQVNGLSVRVEHPDCPSQTVAAEIAVGKHLKDPPLRAPEVSIELPRSSVAVGRVAFEDPQAARVAEVFAYAMGEDVPLDAGFVGREALGADGSLRLRSTFEGRVALVVLAAGHLPETRFVVLKPGKEATLEPIQMEVGSVIRGVVTWAGKAPPKATRIVISTNAEGPRWACGFGLWEVAVDLCWLGGAFEVARRHVVLGPQGEFRAAGISDQLQMIRLNDLPGWSIDSRAPLDGPISAPAEVEVELGFVSVELELSVGERKHPRDGTAEISYGPEGAPLSAHAYVYPVEATRFAVPPGALLHGKVDLPGFEVKEFKLRAPSAAGEALTERLLMVRAKVATLTLPVVAAGKPLEDGATVLIELTSLAPSADQSVLSFRAAAKDGVANFAGIRPGSYSVRAYPGRSVQWRSTLHLDALFEMELAASSEFRRPTVFAPGGNIAFEAKAPEGRLVGMTYRASVFDSEGQAVDVRFDTRIGNSSYGGWTDRGPVQSLWNLPPGTYSIELRNPDFDPVDAKFVVKANEVTRKVFSLVPLD